MNTKNKEGFTIIEVVLVLAIAGLIFMMVFIALPALQRSQRDTQRKNDLSRAMTAINSYQGANRGSLPTNWTTFESQYLTVGGDTFVDPSGAGGNDINATNYIFTAGPTGDLPSAFSYDNQNIIYYNTSAVCGSGGSVTTAGSRKVAVRMYLEGGGVYCISN